MCVNIAVGQYGATRKFLLNFTISMEIIRITVWIIFLCYAPIVMP